MDIERFRSEFSRLSRGWDWKVEGILDTRGYVHPIDSDTKVISTIFERLSSPVIRSIAKRHGFGVEIANQTTYPDFTLEPVSGATADAPPSRIAIDVKTTYASRSISMTLGGYNSFIRNNTKNILYPYDTYASHWILGFVYVREKPFEEYDMESMPRPGAIRCSYGSVCFFVREKHDIAGLRPGSGNTKNIGSIKVRNASEMATASGPFSQFSRPKSACDRYWRDYERLSKEISSGADLYAHPDFSDLR